MGAAFAVSLALLIAMSWRAERRLRHLDRLPMQFGPTGQPGWTAPRRLALAFMPVFAAATFALIALLTPPHAMPLAVAWFVALAFVSGHALHLWLIARLG
ncbi:MAG TPA: hypothetical protein DEA05_10165 [Rhodobacteraceae bacterium]|jgi:hypothetical protein|nr:hypothetical protein [Paracoccaceae bacterium]